MVTIPSPDVKSFWNENGFYLAKAVYSSDEISILEAEFDRIVRQLQGPEDINARWSGPEMDRLDAANTEVIHTHNVQQYSGAWLRALQQDRFLSLAEQFLGPNIVLHHSKLFQKPAEKGSPFPMHQDWQYFPALADSMIAAVIHVSEATDEMGCLRVYPGTHKLGRVQGTSGQADSELLAQYPIENATALEAEPGDVLFFHYFTIHGSMPNRSNQVRKTVLVQMLSGEDEIEAGNLHPDEHLVLKGWNYAMNRGRANVLKK